MSNTNLKDVELRWAFLATPNNKGKFPSNKYQVDLVFDKAIKKVIEGLKNSKQTIKDIGDGLFSLTLKSSKQPLVVMGKNNTKLTTEDLAKIGNGTKAIVQVNQYKSEFGTFMGLQAIKITDLKEFSASPDFGDDSGDVDSDDEPF